MASLPLIVTAAIVCKDDHILITRRPGGSRHEGMWEFPGGKLDPGESPSEGLRRELLEELGLDVAVKEIFEVVYHCYEWGPVLILAYHCAPIGGELRHIQVSDHRWVTPDDLDRYDILPADRPIIEKIQQAASGSLSKRSIT